MPAAAPRVETDYAGLGAGPTTRALWVGTHTTRAQGRSRRVWALLMRGDPVGVVDRVDHPYALKYRIQVLDAGHLEHEPVFDRVVVGGLDMRGQDVDPALAQGARDVFEKPAAIIGLHLDLNAEGCANRLVPRHFGKSLRMSL